MATKSIPSPELMEEVRNQLRAEVREARELLGDLRREIKDARTLVPLLAEELFEAEVKRQVGHLGEATEQAMDAAVTRVIQKFDELRDVLLGQEPHHRRAGKPSIPDLIRRRAGLDAQSPSDQR